MKNNIRKILSAIFALALSLSLTCVAFATEVGDNVPSDDNVAVAFEDGIVPYGSISGYARQTITAGANKMVILCDSSAIFTSGMGMTIKATSANFNGGVSVTGQAVQGTASPLNSIYLPMDGTEVYPQGLTHRKCTAYELTFHGLKSNQRFDALVWIYG